MTCQLYRHFDAQGQLLYVGISLSAIARLAQHAERARWANSIARVDVENYESRERAQKAEHWAIQSEAPTHNVRGAVDLPSSAEVGRIIGFTLAEAYALAAKGETFSTIEPIEFASMSKAQKREHRRAWKRSARRAK